MLQRLRHRAGGQEGFTLIELLVVILIIGILAAVAMPAFLNQKGKAQDASTKSDIRTAQTAEETYYTDNQAYTANTADLTAIEPTLASAVPAPESLTLAAGGNTFTITATSKSTVVYTLQRKADGTVARTCTVPGGANPAGCSNGTW